MHMRCGIWVLWDPQYGGIGKGHFVIQSQLIADVATVSWLKTRKKIYKACD